MPLECEKKISKCLFYQKKKKKETKLYWYLTEITMATSLSLNCKQDSHKICRRKREELALQHIR